MIDTDTLIQAFKRGVEDGLIEEGMIHAEQYAQVGKIADELGDGSEYLWKNYQDGYEFGEYLLHVMSVSDVEVMRE